MTQDLGKGINNYFQRTVRQTVQTSNQSYAQKVYNQAQDSWELQYRQQRYSQPILLTDGIENEKDVDQLLLEVEQRGINQLLEPQGQNR